SALLKPECEAVAIGPLSLVVSLALYESLSGVLGTGADIRLKWPNDVLVNDQKIAGILLETDVDDHGRVNWVALGVGVNIAVAPLERSIALGDCLNTVSANNFRDMFLDHLGRLYRQWLCDGFDARLREDWLSKTYKQGQAISVKIGNTLVNGAFHDIDTHGHLRLKEASGVLKTISAGEVFV
ncbi:MAG: biotin--[acetyl-CoA-carboxylase] ligase, partial [Bdellovibrionales bacterium]